MRIALATAAACWLALSASAAPVFASDPVVEPPKPEPAAKPDPSIGWDNAVTVPEGSVAAAYSPEQVAAIEKVSTYFNELETLKARFLQTDPDGTVLKGKVYVAKPGKFRFEYNRPSRKVVISDGRFMAIQNLDLETDETYELDNTPFRMLLRKEVNLLRDAQVLQVREEPTQISMVLRDKDPEANAAIKVVVTTEPEMVLRGWITRDAQGLETKVEVTNAVHGEKLARKLFVREKLFKRALSGNQ